MQKSRQLHQKVINLKKRLDKAIEVSECVDDDLSNDLQEIIQDSDQHVSSKFPENSFRSIFWKHQMESLNKTGKKKNGNRWHPLMIR